MSNTVKAKQSPFKATKLWNQLLISFKEGMQLKRKRYRLKSYEQCFSGADALDWIHKYLQNHPSFGDHVTKEQSFMLLQKFLDNNVFESAVGKSNKNFHDTNYLYKFVGDGNQQAVENEEKENLPSQKSLTNLLKNVGKRNSTSVELPYENENLNIKTHLTSPLVANFKNIDVSSSTGEGCCSKSLINMDNLYDPAEEENIDVFNSSITESFNRSSSMRVKSNGTIYSGAAGIRAEAIPNKIWVKRSLGVTKSSKSMEQKKSEKRSLSKKKVALFDTNLSFGKRQFASESKETSSPPKRTKYDKGKPLERQCGTSLLPRKAVNVLGEKPSFINQVSSFNTYDVLTGKFSKERSNLTKSEEPSAFSLEKDDKQSENLHTRHSNSSPIRRKLTQKSFSPHPMRRRSLSQSDALISKCRSVFNINETSKKESAENFASGDFYFSNAKKGKYLCKAASTWTLDRIGLSQDTNQQSNAITARELDQTWKSVALLSLRKILKVECVGDYLDCELVEGNYIMRNMDCVSHETSKDAPEWLLSAMNCLEQWPKEMKRDSVALDLPDYPGFERDVYRAIKEHYTSTLKEPLICCHLYPVLEECVDIIHMNNPVAVRLLQHTLLLLPCWNRRQLQLLINFIKRISDNKLLNISKDLPNRDLAIHSFFRIIARKEKHTLTTPYNEGIAICITGFLIDNYEEVFTAPQGLRVQVDHKLAVIHGSLGFQQTLMNEERPYSADDPNRRQRYYCKQITKQEYEKEAVDFSNNAIKDLLQSILDDITLNDKDRAKRLKQFEKAYPDIYAGMVSHEKGNVSVCSSDTQRSRRFKLAPRPNFLRAKMT